MYLGRKEQRIKFRFSYSEQSRVTGADMYGLSIFTLYYKIKVVPLWQMSRF